MSKRPAQLIGSTWRPKRPDDQGDDADRAGKDEARVENLDRDPEHADRHEEDDQVRVDEQVENPLPQRHLDGVDGRAGRVQDEALRLRAQAVDLLEQSGQVGRDDVDDVLLERFLRAQVVG